MKCSRCTIKQAILARFMQHSPDSLTLSEVRLYTAVLLAVCSLYTSCYTM